ncbi:helicase [Duganella sp. FT50W]|uniref:Helicase n=1 Tax=Duganella lactea TaxID=2692173 RepID=A0A6L8MSZ9_9BURK|nr:DEAD/DEAH box helicase [Duganella lactea]MYM85182.1 helicase [Duganella lactea]
MNFTADDIRRSFDSVTFNRGASYFRSRMVLEVERDGAVFTAQVAGSTAKGYRQTIQLSRQAGRVAFRGECSCPMARNCKHVVAVLLYACSTGMSDDDSEPDDGLPYKMAAWLAKFAYQTEQALQQQPAKPARKNEYQAIYVLLPQADTGRLQLRLCKGRFAADGAIHSATPLTDMYALQSKPPAYLSADERQLAAIYIGLVSTAWASSSLEPVSETAALLVRQVAEAGLLYFAANSDALRRSGLRRLQAGPRRGGRLAWHPAGEALKLGWAFDDGAVIDHVMPTPTPMYLAHDLIGTLDLPPALAMLPLSQWLPLIAAAPTLLPRHAAAFAEEMFDHGMDTVLPLPGNTATTLTGVRPTPVLVLRSRDSGAGPAEVGVVAFDYDGQRVSADPRQALVRVRAAGIETIARHQQDEAAAWAALHAAGFVPPSAHAVHDEVVQPSDAAWLAFVEHGLPQLQAQGWTIERAPGFRFDLAAIDDWYANVHDDSADGGHAWLALELGIVVNGASVPLMPVLLQLIRQAPRDFAPAALEARADDEPLLAGLPGGARVALPWGRVKPILRTLGELYFSDRVGDTLRLSHLDAARLAELEAGAQLRWLGGEQLRALGRKLAAFEQVRPVAAPAGLQASLRPYQSEGLAWMQFLREYGLAGILADDMGLGKTIQTLSHILTEKEAGRLTAPALVVAPTSLMDNWQSEAARFTPGLRLLALTGANRAQRYADIAQADVVLTSYALLPRDEDVLRQQPFHLLILDESQYIKNHRAKAAQTAALLQARHRLCLTGTPLQNHLGELWAQFHFLMPGLLGDEKTFNAQFRKPIEKQGDGERNAFLVRRIKPFLLRRTKDSVAKELPPKTEMVRMVDLAGGQRDLYETVRLAMDKKVRDEIARKGVARSQIIILDALLKLRQVCCDPRLLKSRVAGKAEAASAKLQVLLELIEELLAEGRKLLVFSQFTSMLALIEAELKARAVPYALLTGDTTDRAAQVDAFQNGAATVFLISLKAGGVGLNLTAADTVIHYDPWWNPAAENQATDRAWRIGQDKPVFVYRLIARGTLEEKIQELQRTKAGLADAVLAGGEAQGWQIAPEDLLGVLSTGIN